MFNSFREIKVYSFEKYFFSQITETTKKIQKIRFLLTFANSPRYYMEILIFIIVLIFYN